MKIRNAKLEDYSELVEMYKSLIDTVYEGFEKGEDIFFHGSVQGWFQDKKDIIICETDDGIIAGFSLSFIEDLGFLKPYLYGDILFVKESFRKGRTAHLLYNNVVNYADQIGLPLIAKAYIGNGGEDKVDKIQSKFGSPLFKEFVRTKATNENM